jgi:hypothetical protein
MNESGNIQRGSLLIVSPTALKLVPNRTHEIGAIIKIIFKSDINFFMLIKYINPSIYNKEI